MEESAILILVLSDGTQLLATTSVSEGAYMCTNVLQILNHVGDDGQVKTGLQEFLPYAEPTGGLAIPTNMAMIALPKDTLKNFYSEKFGLIITPPEPKIVLA